MEKERLMRPRKMKQIEFTIWKNDIDAVIEFLGRRALIHLPPDDDSSRKNTPGSAAHRRAGEKLKQITKAAEWLGTILPSEPAESSRFPGEEEERLADTIIAAVSSLASQEKECLDEQRKVEDAYNEAKAFDSRDTLFSNLDKFSYLTLKVGRLDPSMHERVKQNLSGNAVIIPLSPDEGEAPGHRVLAVASRKGRFTLDSELKKTGFDPIDIPEGHKGVPPKMIDGFEQKLENFKEELEKISEKRESLRSEYTADIQMLAASYIMASIIEQLKASLVATQNAYLLSGWIPAAMVKPVVEDIEKLTGGRIAVRAYNPEEIDRVKDGGEKVPVSLHNGPIAKGFEKVVFSYGAPLYGTIDPTPIVAFFFTLFFGIMFGDIGHGFTLFLLGILTSSRGPALFSRFRKFSVPLKAVGISSMFMGLLVGSVFTNEHLLEGPTRAVTGFLIGRPMDRILTLLPLAEHGGSVSKLFYFFGFTIIIGIVLNSAGLILNIANRITLKEYDKAFFTKTGLAGALFFWYAIFIAVRFVASMIRSDIFTFSFHLYDLIALIIPLQVIFWSSAVWRLLSGKRPVFSEGLLVFIIEGLVEILETISVYISNTVSFLRVGAFALSHAVLAYIVFMFAERVSSVPAGTIFSIIILVFGNSIIILLEGLIVAIQVVRLQYYEFFSKFFTEAGIEFSPFRFRKERST